MSSRSPFERRVTEKTIVRPLDKTDLHRELRFEPAQLFHFFGVDAFTEIARAAVKQIGKIDIYSLGMATLLRKTSRADMD